MPFHLDELLKHDSASDSDLYLLPAIADVHLRAWMSSPLFRTIYYGPAESHPAVMDNMMARHRKSITGDPQARYAVVLHSELPEVGEPWKVVAFLQFRIIDEVDERKYLAESREWPPYTNMALVSEFWPAILQAREKYGNPLGPHVHVGLLATNPEFHRKGAGKMLMEFAVAEADKIGLPCMLESTPEAMKLYKSVGFEAVDTFWTDLARFENGGDKGKEWRGEDYKEGIGDGWYQQIVMVRPAKEL